MAPFTFAASQLWRAGARVRSAGSPQYLPPIPVLSIGNLQVGGTGKTPTCIAVGNALQRQGFTPIVLSRGYGRAKTDTILVDDTHTAQDVGDEPILLHRSGLATIVATNRQAAAELGLRTFTSARNPIFMLDDGFTQKQITVDMHVVMWDSEREGSDACIPYGNLRADQQQLAQADVIIKRGNGTVPSTVKSSVAVMEAQWQNPTLTFHAGNSIPHNARVLVATGLGNPGLVVDHVAAMGYTVDLIALADHCVWDLPIVRKVQAKAKSIGAHSVIITAKDEVKRDDWHNLWPSCATLTSDWTITNLDALIDHISARFKR